MMHSASLDDDPENVTRFASATFVVLTTGAESNVQCWVCCELMLAGPINSDDNHNQSDQSAR